MSSSIERDAEKAQIMTGDARRLIRAGVSEATAVEIALLSAPEFEDEQRCFSQRTAGLRLRRSISFSECGSVLTRDDK